MELKDLCSAEILYLMKRRDGTGTVKTYVLNTVDESSELGWDSGVLDLVKHTVPICAILLSNISDKI